LIVLFDFGGITTVFPAFLSGSITRSSASYALSAISVCAVISVQIVCLPWRKMKARGIAQSVAHGVDFGGQSAFAAANRFV
jgi:hypothetical protein